MKTMSEDCGYFFFFLEKKYCSVRGEKGVRRMLPRSAAYADVVGGAVVLNDQCPMRVVGDALVEVDVKLRLSERGGRGADRAVVQLDLIDALGLAPLSLTRDEFVARAAAYLRALAPSVPADARAAHAAQALAFVRGVAAAYALHRVYAVPGADSMPVVCRGEPGEQKLVYFLHGLRPAGTLSQ
jgi:hypothetical protein